MRHAAATAFLIPAFLAGGAAAQPAGGSLMPCPATPGAFEGWNGGDCACWRPGVAPVRGTGTYTADSATCAAAVHAGVITATGGTVRVVILPGQASYAGSLRNGIASESHGPAPRSFRVERGGSNYGAPPR